MNGESLSFGNHIGRLGMSPSAGKVVGAKELLAAIEQAKDRIPTQIEVEVTEGGWSGLL